MGGRRNGIGWGVPRGGALRRLALAAMLCPAAPALAQEADLASVLTELRPKAAARGIPDSLVAATFAGLTIDPSVAALTRRQPEFAKPMGRYLSAQLTAARVAQGRAMSQRWGAVLASVQARSGVPGAVVLAVWGLETGYGAAAGDKDVIRSMATLAALGVRRELYEDELVDALALLASGEVTRGQLRGSWAGAMGQPQFMPSSFSAYAVDGDGDGRRDIWADVPDALASIGNFLKAKGWVAGEPWGFEVSLSAGLDPADSRASFAQWAARGVRRTDGRPLPASGDGILFFPVGAGGPAFLVTPNFEVIKAYNQSDAYVLSVASLADRIAGGAPLRGPWPDTVGLSRDKRIALQARLVALGYTVDDRQGRISLAFRDTIRQAQRRFGQIADGEPTDALLAALSSPSATP